MRSFRVDPVFDRRSDSHPASRDAKTEFIKLLWLLGMVAIATTASRAQKAYSMDSTDDKDFAGVSGSTHQSSADVSNADSRPAPEPPAMLLVGLGGTALLLYRRQR